MPIVITGLADARIAALVIRHSKNALADIAHAPYETFYGTEFNL